MVKRSPPVSSPARELAAKLAVITTAAPGLRAAGVTKATIGADSFELLELPAVPPKGDGDDERGAADPYSVEGFRGPKPVAGGS